MYVGLAAAAVPMPEKTLSGLAWLGRRCLTRYDGHRAGRLLQCHHRKRDRGEYDVGGLCNKLGRVSPAAGIISTPAGIDLHVAAVDPALPAQPLKKCRSLRRHRPPDASAHQYAGPSRLTAPVWRAAKRPRHLWLRSTPAASSPALVRPQRTSQDSKLSARGDASRGRPPH